MSVVIFLPLFLTKVGNNNFWATMKQNKTKITKKEEKKSQPKKETQTSSAFGKQGRVMGFQQISITEIK